MPGERDGNVTTAGQATMGDHPQDLAAMDVAWSPTPSLMPTAAHTSSPDAFAPGSRKRIVSIAGSFAVDGLEVLCLDFNHSPMCFVLC